MMTPQDFKSSSAPALSHWKPGLLTLPFIAILGLLVLALISVLEVIYHYCRINHGLATASAGQHFWWTYIPTAVFVTIAALWDQLDTAAKRITPWEELAKPDGACTEKSVFLDYLARPWFKAIPLTLRNQHYLVLCTVFGSVILQSVTILSTSLLVLDEVTISGPQTTFQATNNFAASNLPANWQRDSNAAFIIFGNRTANLTLPLGSTDGYSYQSFQSHSDASMQPWDSVTGTVDAFHADIECEIATIKTATFEDGPLQTWNVQYYTSDCEGDSTLYPSYNFSAGEGNYRTPELDRDLGIEGIFLSGKNCPNYPEGDKRARRIEIHLALFEQLDSTSTDAPRGAYVHGRNAMNATYLLCLPHYSITSAVTTFSKTSQLLRFESRNDTKRFIPGLDFWMLNGAIDGGADSYIEDNPNTFWGDSHQSTFNPQGSGVDTFFALINSSSAKPTKQLSLLSRDLDPNTLMADSKHMYSAITAQIASRFFLQPGSAAVSGHYNYQRQRVMVRQVPLRVIQGLLGLLLFLLVFVAWRAPTRLLPRSYVTIPGLALLLRASPSARKTFLPTINKNTARSMQLLQRVRFQSQTVVSEDQERFVLNCHETPKAEMAIKEERHMKEGWFKPLAFKWPLMIITAASTISLATVLEILLSVSRKNGGLAIVPGDQNWHYIWTLIPTSVLASVAMIYGILSSEVNAYRPYFRLCRTKFTKLHTLLDQNNGNIALLGLLRDIRNKECALVTTYVAATISPFLTIAASGLFTTHPVSRTWSTSVHLMDRFNYSASIPIDVPDWGFKFTEGIAPTLVVQANSTYPVWTSGELAFPELALDEARDSSSTIRHLNVNLTALRAEINCTEISQSRINVTVSENDTSIHWGYTSGPFVPIGVDIDMACVPDTWLQANGSSQVFVKLLAPVDTSSWYFGSTYRLASGTVPFSEQKGCIGGHIQLLGHATNLTVDDVRVMVCNPYTETADVNVTFDLPAYTVSTNTPPVVKENTARFFSHAAWSPDLFIVERSLDGNALEPFYQALVYGRDGVPAQAMVANSTLWYQAVEHLYRIYAAQQINTELRMPLTNLDTDTSLPAILTDPRVQRLVQSTYSTHILTALLLTLLLCATVAYIEVWRGSYGSRRLLPQHPTSIAAGAALLVGSRLVEDADLLPPGAETMSDEALKAKEWFQALEVRLQRCEDGRFGIETRS